MRAATSTLLLNLPDPPELDGAIPDTLQKRLLARDLAASGLLKADDDWDAQHPRTGTALLFDTIFVPSANPLVDTGPVLGRPDMSYRWAHDETSVTFSALVGDLPPRIAAYCRASAMRIASSGETR